MRSRDPSIKSANNETYPWSTCRLQNMVIDLEVAAGTPSPTVDPSVRVILLGHSMGGIVAADTTLAILNEDKVPVKASSAKNSVKSRPSSSTSSLNSFMFPFVQGILAFDTPYLGISPGVVAHGAEQHYNTATSAYSAVTEVAGLFGWGRSASSTKKSHAPAAKALPAGPSAAKETLAASTASTDAAATPVWQKWGKYAMFAGAAGAVAAGGAAAYMKRDALTDGWTWVGSHLEFVGCLMRGEELKSRMNQMSKLKRDKGIGFADLYTVLGRGSERPSKVAVEGFTEVGGIVPGDKRTFCNIPAGNEWKPFFYPMTNTKAKDETIAHMSMFTPRENPNYYAMRERAKNLIVEWVETGWYDSSEASKAQGENFGEGKNFGPTDAFEKNRKLKKEEGLADEEPVIVD